MSKRMRRNLLIEECRNVDDFRSFREWIFILSNFAIYFLLETTSDRRPFFYRQKKSNLPERADQLAYNVQSGFRTNAIQSEEDFAIAAYCGGNIFDEAGIVVVECECRTKRAKILVMPLRSGYNDFFVSGESEKLN